MARLIAIAALIPLASALWSFIDLARPTYRWDGVAVPRETFAALSDGVVTPILLFGVAAIVEMLFRIAERTPVRTSDVSSRLSELKPWLWRSVIAQFLLLAAALTAVAGVWSVFDIVGAMAGLADTSPEERNGLLVRGTVDAIVAAMWIVALAAGVEYLGRIARAAPPNEEEPT